MSDWRNEYAVRVFRVPDHGGNGTHWEGMIEQPIGHDMHDGYVTTQFGTRRGVIRKARRRVKVMRKYATSITDRIIL